MVNEGLRQLVTRRHGEEAWGRVVDRSGGRARTFVAMRTYDDALTYQLVTAAAEELAIPLPELLESFGEFWITDTAERGYGALLDVCGASFPDFLTHIDGLHSRIKLAMPELDPPSISTIVVAPGLLRLRYESKRAGLAPFVIGLVKGLAKRFAQSVSVEQVASKDAGAAADEFLVHHRPLA